MNRFFFLLVIIILTAGCNSSRKLTNRNLSYLYSSGINFIFPDYKPYNINPDSVRVFFSIDSDELLFMKDDSSGSFRSSLSIFARLTQSYESKSDLDTAEAVYSFIRDEGGDAGTITGHFDVFCPDSANYILEITMSDLNRQQAVISYLTIDRTGIQSPGNFMIYDADLNEPVIKNYTDRRMKIRLVSADSGKDKIFMRYFRNDYPISPPPFTEGLMKPLSYISDEARLVDISQREEIILEKNGIYHFQYDTLLKEGFTFFKQEEDFPLLTSANGLIESIRYLTTRQEYDKILNSSDQKQAVDNYWLSMAGNRERARNLIKSYYSRVQFANRMFSSHVEGWKSDRGIIYIIFGPPATVYRSSETETWSYSQNSYYGSLNFNFDKLQNPFSDNDYKLRRSSYYEIPWYRAVDSWRDGRVVNDTF
jgi:GWxTD domain-containing protein